MSLSIVMSGAEAIEAMEFHAGQTSSGAPTFKLHCSEVSIQAGLRRARLDEFVKELNEAISPVQKKWAEVLRDEIRKSLDMQSSRK